ncbi:MAG TPA: PHP domain-containing protein [Candidatus Saccharimonadales bacterium]|nr:PHP domain-containing protein [Candidatus Saccharimonadales bacterium]
MYRVDLHTHSHASPDGALVAAHYRRMLDENRLHCIAVTDHNTTDFARQLQAELGDRIIVGEEITTTDGEIIGLFLRRTIPAGLSLNEAVQAIKQQHGLVYVPHPFETVRKGLSLAALDTIADDVDILEVRNGRALVQNRADTADEWASEHDVPGAASSDSHGWHGWGRTYSVLAEKPSRTTLVSLLDTATHHRRLPGARGILYPKMNRLLKRAGLQKRYRHAA